jgi:hypothetical protein
MMRDSMADSVRKAEAEQSGSDFGGFSRSVQKIDVEAAAPIAGEVAETAIKKSVVSSSICHQP